jgi:hypothetical protein
MANKKTKARREDGPFGENDDEEIKENARAGAL